MSRASAPGSTSGSLRAESDTGGPTRPVGGDMLGWLIGRIETTGWEEMERE